MRDAKNKRFNFRILNFNRVLLKRNVIKNFGSSIIRPVKSLKNRQLISFLFIPIHLQKNTSIGLLLSRGGLLFCGNFVLLKYILLLPKQRKNKAVQDL